VFAAAPYIGFLAPVAALSVGLPFIIGYAVFSVVTIALSYKAISKNKTISEKDAQLAKKEDKVQAQERENSELEKKVKAQEEENSEQKTQLAEKNKKIEEDKLKVAIADGTVQLAKEALNSVGSSLYSRFHGTKVSSPEEQFKREDGSKPSMQELTRLDYLNIDNDVPKQPDHLSIDAAKRYLMSLSEDQDVFYDAESGDEKDTKISSLKEQLDENSKTKIQSRISDLCESVKGKFTSFWSGVQSIYSKNVYNSCVLDNDLLHAQHTSTLANVSQEEVINKEAQKPEEQADQKPNLQRNNSINNTEEGGENKRSGDARRKRKQAQVEQPIVYAVRTSNKYDSLSPEHFLG